jgi:hypothetical protein
VLKNANWEYLECYKIFLVLVKRRSMAKISSSLGYIMYWFNHLNFSVHFVNY